MIKCCNHKLPIVSGRYRNISLEDRTCSLCHLNDVGNETHYLFICPYFINSRKKYIKRYYYTNVNAIKIGELFGTRNMTILLNLAKFVKEITCYFKEDS